MQMADPKVFEGDSGLARLAELGLTAEILVEAVLAAEMERRNCSPLEPSNAPGFKAWAAGVRTLAEGLIPLGWTKVETRGLPRILNPGTAVAIALLHGDDGTGLKHRSPKSKRARGDQSLSLVRSNRKQLLLFPEGPFARLPAEEEEITWWLLIFSEGEANTRAELSLAIGMDEEGRLAEWECRIILTIPDTSLASGRREDEEPIEVAVTVTPKNVG